jgi:NTE family protein
MTRRALVLGGGGPLGVAWEAGLIAGLAEAGVDLSRADFIVGTSAGAFVGARLALGHTPAQLAAPYLEPVAGERRPVPAATRSTPRIEDLVVLGKWMQEAAAGRRPGTEIAAELGKLALGAETISEEQLIARFERELGDGSWPRRAFACTAFDTADGSFRVWDAAAGVDLRRAVASSCAVPAIYPPVTIQGHRYMDGGVLSATNAQLAAGYEVVVVLSVTTKLSPDPKLAQRLRGPLERELALLRQSGARVAVLEPDAARVAAIGPNPMDVARQPEAAQAGHAQGSAEAEGVRAAWPATGDGAGRR